ncbi:hypothetical protein [Treponema pectinovorum]|uniref:hypothetical protein n=1 Tax=Treponema pectinovorum TaxID=164 RepID=UPI0011CC480B|nr:hypothetical protein [Treponema pectinovorum]
MGSLIACCVFGIFIILLGLFFMKSQKKDVAIITFIGGGLFLVAGIVAITLSIPSQKKSKSDNYRYSQFKSDYKRATKICNIPYTLENDVRKGEYNDIIFLTDTTVLYVNNIRKNKNELIDSFNVSVSGKKTNGFYDDSNYALAVVCAVEGFSSIQEASEFINAALNLPIGKYIEGKSGFKYSHGLQDDNGIGFNISKVFMTWDEVIEKINNEKN